jgi:putative colanic acid biosynthesis acetyltransferase WcaF
LAQRSYCYNVTCIEIGADAVISQDVYLCTASHDVRDPSHALVAGPVFVGARAWVAAGAFVGPGVRIGEGAVVGARGVAVRDVQPWTIVAGNPARVLGSRILRDTPQC